MNSQPAASGGNYVLMITVDSSDDIRVAVHDLGGSGAPVLAAHATGFHGRVWAPIARYLDGVHVIAPDFRGHGDTAVPVGYPFHWERFADDVLDTLGALGWLEGTTRPVGIGHSMGGAALLLAEQRRPGTFAALWVYEPITFPEAVRGQMGAGDNALSAGARRRRPRFGSFDDAIKTYGSKPPMNTFAPEALEAYVHGGFAPGPDGDVTIKCKPANEALTYETAVRCDAFEHVVEVQCPTVVLRGRLEAFSPASIAESVATGLAHGRLEVHDELSHFGPMEDPSGMARSIAALAASVDT